MRIHELYEKLLEECLEKNNQNISSHAYWMADLIINLPRDPAFKKLNQNTKDQIEQIIAAIE